MTAFEYADLNRRGRFGADLPLVGILQQLRAEVIGFPADAWRIAERLPALHSDPVDRMLVAHALDACLVIVTADALMRAYPVPTIW